MPREKPKPCAAAAYSAPVRLRALPLLAGLMIAAFAALPDADAKSPGSRYCFHGLCHRVGTLAQTDTLVGWRGYLLASYYDSCKLDRMNPCGLTSSGTVFRPDLPDNAASPLLPDGTVILAYNPKTGDASILRVTNAGPYSGTRKLDVSRAAAEKLGFRKQGVAALVISVLQSPTKAEASYVRRRVYPAVPGYLGRFETVDIALAAAQARFDVREDGEEPAGVSGSVFETASLGDGLVQKPQLAVSPSLARELTMLRTPPRPVSRAPQLVEAPRLLQGPRLASRTAFRAEATSADATRMSFASGLQQYLAARDSAAGESQ